MNYQEFLMIPKCKKKSLLLKVEYSTLDSPAFPSILYDKEQNFRSVHYYEWSDLKKYLLRIGNELFLNELFLTTRLKKKDLNGEVFWRLPYDNQVIYCRDFEEFMSFVDIEIVKEKEGYEGFSHDNMEIIKNLYNYLS